MSARIGPAVRETSDGERQRTSLSLDKKTVQEAKSFGINISRACDVALEKAVKAERQQRWREENRDAFAAWNEYIAENGIPLAKYRMF
ncbi:MAG: type II toxin-antitoxin system CcdA family antitoxin [Pacificimonas sp.]